MSASTNDVMCRIFMSYRREDTAYPAGWLFDLLASHFGRAQVFKDVDSIELGDDFVEVINTAVASCDVLLELWVRDSEVPRQVTFARLTGRQIS